ncbi:PHD/YefM family antitoxin component YafN of YafNO toxin-antitoxin module [Enterococcus sp. PF1-24]|uniref:type II toxin-antitoxin system Phd/YefM family antitoxin n=1 Tax=unclassified Enterococcus TaxID=2608891 RepID=UPI0024748B12|nr:MULTISPECIES: type II toxin-antitoxin system Phd/YefM family antitoxin [unclassified Enterococcus]MDH6365298.1 PHD/YefM family antitoxin component YafN of YafNO toxin-antitoxin module [Enterococcus sp. PFB1-1]MDH6402372.1 PHD/YefM family antitoxin component YafN of YafNO toxin-antitoxin module [Enterococcus sp. PF1-24]
MVLKKLEVPTTSITEVKKSPMDVFEQARQAGTGVYVFNREKVAGVMLTQALYEQLLEDLQKQQEQELTKVADMQAQSSEDLFAELQEKLKATFVADTTISAFSLDEKMAKIGFMAKQDERNGIQEMMYELQKTGKIVYYSQMKRAGERFIAEVVGEQDSQSALYEKMIIKRVYLLEA